MEDRSELNKSRCKRASLKRGYFSIFFQYTQYWLYSCGAQSDYVEKLTDNRRKMLKKFVVSHRDFHCEMFFQREMLFI